MRFLSIAVLFVFSAVGVLSMGCGSDQSVEGAFAAASKENIQKTCAMYSIYLTLHDYTGPASKEEMLSFLKSDEQAKVRLERMGIDVAKLDSYVIGRDGEPYEFRWGVESSPIGGAYVVCWEQTGIDGNVQVGIAGGRIVETNDEEELADLKAGNYSTGATYGQSMNYSNQDE